MASRLPVANLRQSTLAGDDIVEVITRGRAKMPSFRTKLDHEAIRALADKVLSLRR